MRSILVSLPVANLRVSAAFFEAVGFTVSPEPAGAQSACVVIDDNVRVLLIERDRFQDQINGDSLGIAGEFLTGLAVDSELEVDQILARAIAAGGRPWPIEPEPAAYSGAFRDLDGHLWQISYRRPEPVPGPVEQCEEALLLADSLRPMLAAEPERRALAATAG